MIVSDHMVTTCIEDEKKRRQCFYLRLNSCYPEGDCLFISGGSREDWKI
jgi:hypothetical protein